MNKFDDFDELNFDELNNSFEAPSDDDMDKFFGEAEEKDEKAPKLCPHCGKEV